VMLTYLTHKWVGRTMREFPASTQFGVMVSMHDVGAPRQGAEPPTAADLDAMRQVMRDLTTEPGSVGTFARIVLSHSGT
jgi:hypothetical protein